MAERGDDHFNIEKIFKCRDKSFISCSCPLKKYLVPADLSVSHNTVEIVLCDGIQH